MGWQGLTGSVGSLGNWGLPGFVGRAWEDQGASWFCRGAWWGGSQGELARSKRLSDPTHPPQDPPPGLPNVTELPSIPQTTGGGLNGVHPSQEPDRNKAGWGGGADRLKGLGASWVGWGVGGRIRRLFPH